MLYSIHVKNFALIDEVEIDLGKGLNIITGETGAGKSIVIDAVNFALGKKMSKDIVREDADYCFSELIFDICSDEIRDKLKELDIYCEDEIILSRKITNGRNVCKINGETVNTNTLKEISSLLIDIHGQHDHQSLFYKKGHALILDNYCGSELSGLKNSLHNIYWSYIEKKNEFESATNTENSRERDLDIARHEVNEIESARLVAGEDEELEKTYKRMVNSKKLLEAVATTYSCTGYDEYGAGSMIGRALSQLNNVAGEDDNADSLLSFITDIDSLLNDFNRQIADYKESLEFSEEDFRNCEDRLDLINNLKRRYGNTIEDILDYCEKKKSEIEKYEDYDAYISNLKNELYMKKSEVISVCEKISKIRKSEASKLANSIHEALVDLNFLDANFEIKVEPDENKLSSNGYDDIEMLISTNPGENLKPLKDIASGGEISRIMLAIKSVMAEKDSVSTLIFDEIDTGISGRTAQKVSEKMANIANAHQVICVTHLPQIAAMADDHFEIKKSVINDRTVTDITLLSQDGSVDELARMLGGTEITDAVLLNAKEMKDLANKFKTEE